MPDGNNGTRKERPGQPQPARRSGGKASDREVDLAGEQLAVLFTEQPVGDPVVPHAVPEQLIDSGLADVSCLWLGHREDES